MTSKKRKLVAKKICQFTAFAGYLLLMQDIGDAGAIGLTLFYLSGLMREAANV